MNKIVTLKDKNDEVVIPIGVGQANAKAEWFTVKLGRVASENTKTFTTRNGGKYTFHSVNGSTGWWITSENRDINIFRTRTEFIANGGNAIGAHGVKSGSRIWTRVYGDYKEGIGAQSKREGYYDVASSDQYGQVIAIGDDNNKLAGRLSYTMMRERSGGGWRCFCDCGTGYHVNWSSLDIELVARDETTGPTLYVRAVNDSNIVNAFTVIDVLEEL